MKEIVADKNLIAYCGLYCGACKKYLLGECPGCQKNEKASWCKTRTCCIENSYLSCADCSKFPDKKNCKKVNNIISQIFGFIFNSDRVACLDQIKEKGYDAYAKEMADEKQMTIKRKNKI